MRWVWLNRKLVLHDKACFPVSSKGFLIGQGLFETMRCYQGKFFLLDEHLDRLIESCPLLGIKPPKKKRLKEAVALVIERNRLKEASLRLDVFKQEKGIGIFVFSRNLHLPSKRRYKEGFSVMLEKNERLGVSFLNNLKTLNHFFYNHLTQFARERGFDEAFFLNVSGEVVEGARTNIFLVKEGKVSTPLVSCGCLPGITRAKVIDLLKRSRIPILQRRVFPKELFSQDEIFVTNSLLGVSAVTRLDKKPIKQGQVGPLTKNIMAAYQIEVEKACLLR